MATEDRRPEDRRPGGRVRITQKGLDYGQSVECRYTIYKFCVQPRPLAVYTALPAFAGVRRAAIDQYPPLGPRQQTRLRST